MTAFKWGGVILGFLILTGLKYRLGFNYKIFLLLWVPFYVTFSGFCEILEELLKRKGETQK